MFFGVYVVDVVEMWVEEDDVVEMIGDFEFFFEVLYRDVSGFWVRMYVGS